MAVVKRNQCLDGANLHNTHGLHIMIDMMEYFNAGNKVLSASNSMSVTRTKHIIQSLKEHTAFKSDHATMQTINTKILYAINLRVDLWLKQCIEFENRDDVNNNIIDLYPLISNIALGTLGLNLHLISK
jgi:phosphoheptose isomerase